MTRGEVWTVSGAGYAGKPRPAVIVQDDRFDVTESITVCVFTTDETDAPLFRLPVTPSAEKACGKSPDSWSTSSRRSTSRDSASESDA